MRNVMKRCLSMFLALTLLVGSVPMDAFASEVDSSAEAHVHTEAEHEHETEAEAQTVEVEVDEEAEVSEDDESQLSEDEVNEESNVSEETTTKEESTSKPKEKTQVEKVQEMLDAFMVKYDLTVGMSDKEIEEAVYAADSNPCPEYEAIIAVGEKLTEEEVTVLLKNYKEKIEITGEFYNLIEEMNTPATVTEHSILNGVITVKDSLNNSTFSDGSFSCKAQSSLFSAKTNTITITNNTADKIKLTFNFSASSYGSFSLSSQSSPLTTVLDGKTSMTITLKGQSVPLVSDASLTLSGFSYVVSKDYFMVEDQTFDNLTDAITAAGSNGTIVLIEDYTVPAGNYTIPAGVTLLIPFDATNTCYVDKPVSVKDAEYAKTRKPTAYRTLTMADGANIVVNGTMSVSAKQFAAGGSERGASMPYKTYGYVKMADGSSITVNNAGKLAVYGYISGSGGILAKSGSKVYESFQFEDFRGGSKTSDMKNKVFMLSQYYVQNIEVPLTLESGATEYSYASIEALEMAAGSSVAFISNTNAMFNLTNGEVTKYYDKKTDRLIIDAEGDITVNPLSMQISIYSINSADYALPINSNMTLNVKSGSIALNQDIALLPGAKINIAKDVTCTLGSGKSIYVYDADQWGGYTSPSDKKILPVSYVPERVYTRTEADLIDAEINIAGKVDASAGYVYTTEGGANIHSTGGGIATITPGPETVTYQYKQTTDSYDSIPITSAKLTNGDGSSFVSKADTYTYTDGRWRCSTCVFETAATCESDSSACTGCGTVISKLGHDYVTEITTEATCETKGLKTSTCKREGCGKTETEEIAALGHNYETEITTEATCLTDGVKTFTCKNDSTHTYTETIPALGHTEEVVAGKDATCTEDGLTDGKKCSVCGVVTVEQETIKATGHQLDDGDILLAATCKTEGKIQYSCQNCDYTEDEIIPVDENAHVWVEDTRYRVEPTCTSDGKEVFYCDNECGIEDKTNVLSALGHLPGEEATCETAQTCQRENCGVELVPALGHNYDEGVVTKAATCEVDGVKTFTCANDERHTYTETIKATGHVEDGLVLENVVNSTCTTEGHYDEVVYCSVCDKELTRVTKVTDALGHTEEVLAAVAPTCEETGLTEGKKCLACGETTVAQTVVDALGHNYVSEITKSATCTEAGEETFTCNNDASHTYTKEIPATGHTEETVAGKDATCTETGITEGKKCSVCGVTTVEQKEIPPKGHTEEVVAGKDATCEKTGLTEGKKCSVCGVTLVAQEEIPATGHNLNDGEVLSPATCHSTGKIQYSCQNCDYTEERTIPVDLTAHEWELDERVEPTCVENGKEVYYCKYFDLCKVEDKVEVISALGHEPGEEATCETAQICQRENCGGEIVAALGHDWVEGEVLEEPTCTKVGKKQLTCQRENCGKTTTEEIEMLEHVSGEAVVENNVDPTCEEEGSYDTVVYCTVGGEELSRETTKVAALGHTEEILAAVAPTCESTGLTEGKKCTVCGNTTVAQTVVDALGHDWDNGTITVEPTCTVAGEKTFTCNNDETHTYTEVVNATGHTEAEAVIENEVAATCTSEGSYDTVVYCSVCKEELSRTTEAVPVIAHTEGGAVAENRVEATCTAAGSYDAVVYCTVCEKELTRETVILPIIPHSPDQEATCETASTCTVCETVLEEALGHNLETKVTKEATCTDDGVSTETCSRCDYENEKTIPATGHDWLYQDIVVEATCTETGMSGRSVCWNCSAKVDGEIIPALGHDWDEGVVTKDATCTQEGSVDFECQRTDCGETKTETIEALGHTKVITEAVAPTCTETGLTEGEKCSTCGEIFVAQEEISALGHTEEVVTGKEATCTETGLTEGKKCSVCGEITVAQEEIPAKGHTNAEAVVENEIEATCETAGSYDKVVYCSVCNVEVSRETVTTDVLGHTEEVVAGKAATCTETGLTEGKKCIVCGKITVEQEEIPALGHINSEVVVENKKEATCTLDGSYENVVYCTVCDEEISRETITVPAKGHVEEVIPGKDATCEETGLTEGKKCSVCDEITVAQEEIPAKGHVPGEIVKENEKAPKCVRTGSYDAVVYCTECTKELSRETIEVAALGHKEEVLEAVEATCTETGLKEGKYCPVCDTVTVIQEIIPAKGHTNAEAVVENEVAATCTEKGSYDSVVYCSVCDVEVSRINVEVDVLPHTEEVLEALEATCTETGLTEGKKCSVCGEILVVQEEIPATGHTEEVLEAVEATCTETGLTEGKKCSVCDEILVAQEEIPATGHTEEVLEAVEATCTETGLTEGKKCSVCDEILAAQEVISAKGHVADEVIVENEMSATCTEKGSYENVVYCAVCDEELSRETVEVAALGHTEEVLEAVEATCTEAGLTEGKKCSVCDEVLAAQEEIPAKGHEKAEAVRENEIAPTCTRDGQYDSVVYCTVCEKEVSREKAIPIEAPGHKEVIDPAVDATCTESGLKEGKHCEVCNKVTVAQEKVPALGHTEEVLEAVEATCTETGLTEGKKCSVCDEILVAQEEVAALGHTEEVLEAVEATCTETGLTEGKKCSVCDEILVAQEEVAALGHTEEVLEAVSPTCTETGLTEGKKCSVCDEILVAQEVVPTVEHIWNRGIITVTPNCTEDGERKFTCIVCGGFKTEVEEKLGHDLVQIAGKKPTYTENGWKDYERCTREDCLYSTYEVIPALGEQSVETFDEFINNLEILENIADQYVKKVAPGKDAAGLVIKYIRTGVDRYNSGSWNIMAGYEDADFAKYVKEYEASYNEELEDGEELMAVTGLKNIEEFELPNGDHADIGHVFGTMDITYTNNANADVGGWAGDLVDLLSLVDQFGVESTTIEEMVKEINTKYYFKYREDFEEEPIEGTFSKTDVYGDLDAYYLMKTLVGQEYENGTLTNLFKNYMTSSLTDVQRASYFLKNRLNGAALRGDVRDAVYNTYLAEKGVATLENTREFNTEDLTDLRKAVCYVFADYLCKLAGDYVESTENEYLKVFQSTSSTLAPGITQKINYATTADGKRMVYYLATGDVTRSDVNVYANYNNNDPAGGWAMQRVLDQANAAQKKYGDPESPQYIENYNVIASINGDGFNMQTGEPGGLLVMDGVEWHPCDGSGFFAILADGTARIGTQTEYNQLKAEGKIKEAIGAFGTSLVKDGKISITASGDYYSDRAGRTAVGITATGKVVFLVIDGRQGDFSCGASAIEIAQIMLDAGCYQAVNLDGGGSSTYVAREEGADSLAVVSKPSDGAARSVSTSLMMVSTAPSSNEFDRAILESDYSYLTKGATAKFKASGVSATGNAVEIPEGAKWEVANTSVGTISEDGVFTAKALGTTEVNLTLDGKVVGTKKINVVIPDSVYFSRDTMNAICGQETVLPVKAAYEGKSVAILESDIILTLAHKEAGTINGFKFIADEASGLKKVTVTAQLVENAEATTGSITLNIYTQDEAMFDFDKATGGDPQLAWAREVSNAVDEGNNYYSAIDREKDMETSYTFAIDMSKIDIPEQLADLTYMLPGADMENASAWNFLLQLAERVSVLTEVRAKIDFDDNMEVDYEKMSVSNEYFLFDRTEFDKETNTLSLIMKWKDQTDPIDAETANPLCIVSGIKLTPKDDAKWNEKEQLNVVNSGEISYDIYLRANALFTFAQKEENQKIYGLKPFENPDFIDATGAPSVERGASFGSVYKKFEDTYSLNKAIKDGWVIEDGGFAYYKDGEKLTGIQELDGVFYNFGTEGINTGKTPCHGEVTDLDGKQYYFNDGKRVSGWIIIDEKNISYYNPETFEKEKLTADETPSTCIIDGYCIYTSESGAVKRVDYDDAGGHEYVEQADGSNVCSECGWVRVEMQDATTTLSYYVTTYTGTAKTPATTVVSKNGITLTKPPTEYHDYSSKYENNVNVGTATVTMTASRYGKYSNLNTWRGNAAGSTTATFEIRPDLPTNVVATTSGTKINVSWEAAKTPGVTYVVYATKDGETWTEYTTTEKLSCQLKTTDKITLIKIGTRKVVNGKTYNSIETTEQLGFALYVTADNREDGKPQLKWNAMAGAKSYEVYRSTTKNGTYNKVFTTTGTTYTHVSATAGKTYYYKLKVIYEDGRTETSEILMNQCLIPSTEFQFTLGHQENGKPTVKWNPIIGASYYEVYRSDSQDGSFQLTFTTKGVTYTNTAAIAGNTYYYKVIVYYNDGTTMTSEVISNDCQIPNTKLTAKISNREDGKPVVTWNSVVGAQSYEVYRATKKNGTYKKVYTTNGTRYINTGATPGKTYFYKVKVTYVDDSTQTSNIVSIKCKYPNVKITVKATNRADGKIALKWNAIKYRYNYTVYRATAKNGTYKKMFTTKGTSYTNTSAEAGKTYYYKVKVTYDDQKTTKMSSIVSKKCLKATTSIKVTASNRADGKPVIKWNAIKNASSVAIYRSTSKSGKYTKLATSTGLSYADTKAKAGKKYYYKIKVTYVNKTTKTSGIVSVKCLAK